jgi:hypothetical protein
MDTARLEALCFVYAGILLSVAGVVLAWTQSDLSWLVIYSTGPLFVVFGVHRLRTPGRPRPSDDSLGPRLYSLLAFDLLVTLVVAFQFYAHFA